MQGDWMKDWLPKPRFVTPRGLDLSTLEAAVRAAAMSFEVGGENMDRLAGGFGASTMRLGDTTIWNNIFTGYSLAC